jgi:heat shock protein HslJ
MDPDCLTVEELMRPRSLACLGFILLAACAGTAVPDSSALLGPDWVIEDIGGRGILDNSMVTLRFEEGGRSGGKGSCNTYGVGYQIDGEKITFEQPFSTMMACAEALMNQERALFDLLPQITRFDIADDGALVLSTTDGRTITARR